MQGFTIMKYLYLIFFLTVIGQSTAIAQGERDSVMLRQIYDHILTEGTAYEWLDYLANNIGGRLSGSPEAAAAVEWAHQVMDTLGLDSVWLQPVMVPHWVRGGPEEARIISRIGGNHEVIISALGGSTATPSGGLAGEVVEVHSFDELEKLGKKNIKGKIVFYNTPMDPRHIHTFHAYGNCVQYRFSGAGRADVGSGRAQRRDRGERRNESGRSAIRITRPRRRGRLS